MSYFFIESCGRGIAGFQYITLSPQLSHSAASAHPRSCTMPQCIRQWHDSGRQIKTNLKAFLSEVFPA
jgi:hypothetical protein